MGLWCSLRHRPDMIRRRASSGVTLPVPKQSGCPPPPPPRRAGQSSQTPAFPSSRRRTTTMKNDHGVPVEKKRQAVRKSRGRRGRRPRCGLYSHGTGRSSAPRWRQQHHAVRRGPGEPRRHSRPTKGSPSRSSGSPRACSEARLDRGADVGPLVGQGQHAGGRWRWAASRRGGGERRVVDAALAAADDQRDPAAVEGVQRGVPAWAERSWTGAVIDDVTPASGGHRRQPPGQRPVACQAALSAASSPAPGTPSATRERRAISALRRLCLPEARASASSRRRVSLVAHRLHPRAELPAPRGSGRCRRWRR